MKQTLKEIRIKSGKRPTQVARDLFIQKETYYAWENKKHNIKDSNKLLLCYYFDVNMDEVDW